MAVNAVPVIGSDKRCRGVVITFDDLTTLEEKNETLRELLEVLQQSRDEIAAQNEELQWLATRDPLTSCLNRRSFFSQVEQIWQPALDAGQTLGVVMLDIDHFKSVNDNHGHAMGDEVLRHVSALLRDTAGEQDLVCRYGGEEFCLLLPQMDLASAQETAEKIRSAVETAAGLSLQVTVSLGCWVLLPSWPEHGVLAFRVQDIPARLEQAGMSYVFEFQPIHDPEEENYSHTEIRTYRDGIHDKKIEPPKTIRKKFRQMLAEKARLLVSARV